MLISNIINNSRYITQNTSTSRALNIHKVQTTFQSKHSSYNDYIYKKANYIKFTDKTEAVLKKFNNTHQTTHVQTCYKTFGI